MNPSTWRTPQSRHTGERRYDGMWDGFHHALALDADTWARGRAWTLWKALILAAGLTNSNAVEAANPWRVIDGVLEG